MISQLLDELDMAEAHKEKCQARMLEICEREFPEELRRLQTIPGINPNPNDRFGFNSSKYTYLSSFFGGKRTEKAV